MKSVILALFLAVCAQTVLAAEQTPRELELRAQRKQADDLREQAKEIRKEAQTQYRQDDAACMKKVLVNACRNSARETSLNKIKIAREKEIDANRIDSAAKAELAKLHAAAQDAARQNQSAPAEHSRQTGHVNPPAKERPADGITERIAPPPAPSPAAVATAEARKQQHVQQAAQARAKENAAAKQRASKAKEDAAHYAARAKIIAERKAERAAKEAKQSAPAAKN